MNKEKFYIKPIKIIPFRVKMEIKDNEKIRPQNAERKYQ